MTQVTDFPLLRVEELKVHFFEEARTIKAVDGVSYELDPGETLGIVGESGCGKTVTASALLRLIPSPPGKIVAGRILLDGEDILTLDEENMRKVRGRVIAMIFQDPTSALNPVFTVGSQITYAVRAHRNLPWSKAWQRAVDMLALVGIPDPERRAWDYPHQFSGGMRQRVMIAMALSCSPRLLVADEPTTALDVTTQAEILALLKQLKDELGLAVLCISHDLDVIAEAADRVAVMYAGSIVETSAVGELFRNPLHPYTQGLMDSMPRLDPSDGSRLQPLKAISGMVPDLGELPPGCRFAPRCAEAIPDCSAEVPSLREPSPGHRVRCIRR